ncbi:uncharacterized protein STEHIDRAFT_114662 [Stereum hirsutum FP-91666 SS1]|uniref:uncharacterized protein n=1 Tax=Stereum hirsutum (strain FP-91666) TaxID=721885 RepID=UPI000444A46A|nr:uncharacterized protein STEHIDRAFT_114662 [Stereum hirsutum FP-91666 SS1]EIM81987.1 hypothetical protein STEHIDRAFT_114662 [Stereum hirsutum FP-91666 SS1]
MTLCEHCISGRWIFCMGYFAHPGVVHEGETTGTYENIGSIRTYVATPSKEYPKDKALRFLPDALGVEFNNSKLLADAFAANGFKVYLPDVYSGDAVPESAFDQPGSFDIPGWLSRHPASLIEPIIEKVMGALAESKARYVFNLAFENRIACSVVAHPTALQIADLEKYAEVSRAPLLINACTIDPQSPPEKIEAADRILGGESSTCV